MTKRKQTGSLRTGYTLKYTFDKKSGKTDVVIEMEKNNQEDYAAAKQAAVAVVTAAGASRVSPPAVTPQGPVKRLDDAVEEFLRLEENLLRFR